MHQLVSGDGGAGSVEASGSEKDPLIKPYAEKQVGINIQDVDPRGQLTAKFFVHRNLRYIYSEEEEKYLLLM